MGHGWLNLLKPPGMTSHQAVAVVRRVLGLRRVGHTGTLDPAAAGVLAIAVGQATRLADFVGELPKAYRAEVTFGVATDTLDAEGRITQTCEAPVSRETVEAALTQFRGEIRQRPPAYSAVHHQGRRSYELARRGEAVQPEERVVRIDALSLIGFEEGPRARAMLDVVCSKGTYIRSLAADLATAVGSCGYLSFLLRTRVGPFVLADSKTLEELQARGAELLEPMEVGVSHLQAQTLDEDEARRIATGQPVATAAPGGTRLRLHERSGRLLAIAEAADGMARPRIVFHEVSSPWMGEE